MVSLYSLEEAVNALLLGWAATLVFSMQLGFCCLECGTVRQKNVKNILFKNLADAAIAGIMFWMIGYAFAYGKGTNGFVGGGTDYFISSRDYSLFFFQYAFAATSVSIVSGAVAERCTLIAYLGYSILLSGIVYPIVVYWVWSDGGFLSLFRPDEKSGAIDFAGSAVVHLTGGVAALVASAILGARVGKFGSSESATPNHVHLKPHSEPLQAVGVSYRQFSSICTVQLIISLYANTTHKPNVFTFIQIFLLWIGWFGFNSGSVLALASDDLQPVIFGRVLVCTMLGASSAICTGVIISTGQKRHVGFAVRFSFNKVSFQII